MKKYKSMTPKITISNSFQQNIMSCQNPKNVDTQKIAVSNPKRATVNKRLFWPQIFWEFEVS